MQLDRTERAFRRWTAQNLYLEAKVIREGNETIRNLPLAKGHLIAPDLLDAAGLLVEHYDRWLDKFDRLRGSTESKLMDVWGVFTDGARPIVKLFLSDAFAFDRRLRHGMAD